MSDAKAWARRFPIDRPPSMEELDQYADNPLWPELRRYLKDAYGAEPRTEYNSSRVHSIRMRAAPAFSSR